MQCPAYNQKCTLCQKIRYFARVCRSKRPTNPPKPQSQISTNAIRIQSPQGNHFQLYDIKNDEAEAAPIIMVKVTSSTNTKPLPDSGADISAAGQEVLYHLGHHVDNFLSSGISPRAVNGTTVTPLGKIPVTLQLSRRSCKDDLHIYPRVSGALMSWRTARELAILPANYPHPIEAPCTETIPQQVKVTRIGQVEPSQLKDM